MRLRHPFSVLFLLSVSLLLLTACGARKTIRTVAEVRVEAPEGTAPVLPYQVWVTYADRSGEWRQVKWTNSLRETEEEEAALPVGSAYTVPGYVIGDNSTENGFPVEAQVTVVAGKPAAPAQEPVARPLPLGSVRLIGDNRLTANRDLDVQNLLSLDITQLLYNYRDTYGLPTAGYTEAEGWDSPTTKLKGHGSGHYMSALAFAYAGTDDAALRDSLLAEGVCRIVAVGDFNEDYAGKMGGREYPAVSMIEAFCEETGTPDIHVEAMRREWQRRVRREGPCPQT